MTFTKQSSLHYITTRIPSLFHLPGTKISTLNPIPAFQSMSRKDWNYFLLGYIGWSIDAFDFFVSSVTASAVAHSLNTSITNVTWGMTLVLMFRSLGAVVFGFISDTYGRRPSFLICAGVFVIIEIGTGFVQTIGQYLAVRAIFGIVMGGMYGAASATALESAPVRARSILGGIFLPGYNVGFILAIIFWRAFINTKHSWRALFWFSAAPPALLFIWRYFTKEHEFFLEHKRAQREKALSQGKVKQAESPVLQFIDDLKIAIKKHWFLFIYLIFLMSGMNFSSHGSQDLYSVMLEKQIGLSPDARTVTQVVVNLGAIVGGLIVGQVSELTGRRLAAIIATIISSALIYPSFISKSQNGLMAAGFFMQACVMGVWGIVSVHLIELSPPMFRALFAGLAYQLGNLASSASSTIESQAGSSFPLIKNGKEIYDYGKVMALFMTGVNIFLLICFLVGPENFHRNLSAAAAEVGEEGPIVNDDRFLKNDVEMSFGNHDLDEQDLRLSDDKAHVVHREHVNKENVSASDSV